MLSLNNKVSLRQIKALLILDIFGTGIIILPRKVADFANQDGWMLIIGATLLAAFYGYIISSIATMFPNDGFVDYTGKILSKPIAYLISFLFVIKLYVNLALEIRFFAEIVKTSMLPNTPFFVIAITMLLLGGFAADKGYETRARIAEIIIFIVFIPVIFVFCLAMVDVDFTNLMPFMTTAPKTLAVGSFFTAFVFQGLEFCLLAVPYIQKPKELKKSVGGAIFILGLLLVFITAITIAKFGDSDVKRQIWPVLEVMDTINIPGAFIERQDALVLSFWIISVFAIVNAFLFFSSIILSNMFKKVSQSIFIWVSIPIVFILSLFPKDISQAYKIMDFMSLYFGTAFLFVIPLLLLIVAKLRGLGGGRNASSK